MMKKMNFSNMFSLSRMKVCCYRAIYL